MGQEHLNYRRAIEALRAGVPNRDAVSLMGSSQPALEERFAGQLDAVVREPNRGTPDRGMIFASGFGTGKSHILERFQHIALEKNFVCSKVAISKETPLQKLEKVFRSAVESAVIPNRVGACMSELSNTLHPHSESYAKFFKWLQSPECGLCNHFAATVHLFEKTHGVEDLDLVTSFWSGRRVSIPELKKAVKETGLGAYYKIERVSQSALAEQRFLFTPRLMQACGYAGWVILLDETELVGSYGLRSRALAYAVLARMAGASNYPLWPGVSVALAITDDFTRKVLDERDDEGKIPYRYSGDPELVRRAEAGMSLIRKAPLMAPPSDERIKETWDKLRGIYREAYGWEPEAVYSAPDRTNSLRQIIKRWITEWDLARLFPGYQPEIAVTGIQLNIEETPEMETPSEDETQADAAGA